MGQEFSACCCSAESSKADKTYTLEPASTIVISEDNLTKAIVLKPVRKTLNLREKYEKGLRIGKGPFGPFYDCSKCIVEDSEDEEMQQ